MADWYASSAAHAAVPQWAANTAYTVGQFVRALAAPAQPYSNFVHRCTTAGTSGGTEPSWGSSNNQTTASGTAVFTNVTGQSAYGWSAAAGTLLTFGNALGTSRPVAGDRVFVSSDSSETYSTTTLSFSSGAASWGSISIISVNRGGSVPPVDADIQSGATLNLNAAGSFYFDAVTAQFWQGVAFNVATANIVFNISYTKSLCFKDCAWVMNNNAQAKITNSERAELIWDNTTYRVGHAASIISPGTGNFDLTWLNTPGAIQGATLPTSLFVSNNNSGGRFTLRGVDLSALAGTILGAPASTAYGPLKILLDSCRIAPGVTRMYTPTTGHASGDLIELVNCFDGTNVVNERHRAAGVLSTERATTMVGGAADGGGGFSFMMASSSRADKFVELLDSFFLDVEQLAVGVAKTATVEIIASAALNNDDAFLTLEYLGTAGSTLARIASSKPSSVSATALPLSSSTWNNPPGSGVKQRLQAAFTPQTAGRVRGRVYLGKPSTTIYVNPQIAIA